MARCPQEFAELARNSRAPDHKVLLPLVTDIPKRDSDLPTELPCSLGSHSDLEPQAGL